MPIPDYESFMLPALKALADRAETPLSDVCARVAAAEGLTPEDMRELLPRGRKTVPWCINTGKSLIPLTLRFLAQKRNLLIPLELSRVMHQGKAEALMSVSVGFHLLEGFALSPSRVR